MFDVVEPDLLYMSNERAARSTDGRQRAGRTGARGRDRVTGNSWRDETIKRRLYERAGVSEYWVVDPEIDVVRVYRRGTDGFKRPIELTAEDNDVLTTPLLPGFPATRSHLSALRSHRTLSHSRQVIVPRSPSGHVL